MSCYGTQTNKCQFSIFCFPCLSLNLYVAKVLCYTNVVYMWRYLFQPMLISNKQNLVIGFSTQCYQVEDITLSVVFI